MRSLADCGSLDSTLVLPKDGNCAIGGHRTGPAQQALLSGGSVLVNPSIHKVLTIFILKQSFHGLWIFGGEVQTSNLGRLVRDAAAMRGLIGGVRRTTRRGVDSEMTRCVLERLPRLRRALIRLAEPLYQACFAETTQH